MGDRLPPLSPGTEFPLAPGLESTFPKISRTGVGGGVGGGAGIAFGLILFAELWARQKEGLGFSTR